MPALSSASTSPRVALVCDWLTTPGGAEKVLLELHRLYPDATIYTSQYRPKGINWFSDATVRTGWLQFFPAKLRKILGPLRQLYFSHLDLSAYDLVISVTGAEAKSVRTKSATHSAKHLCYCHVPTQYYWQMYHQYLANPGFGFLNPLVRFFFKLFVRPLRRADLVAAQRPDQFVTISQYAATQIQIAYHRDAVIIHPPVDVPAFSAHSKPQKSSKKHELLKSIKPSKNDKLSKLIKTSKKSALSKHPESSKPFSNAPESSPELSQYYIIACRQVNWKRVNLAISACLATHQPLWVVGDGPEHRRLVRLAGGSPLIHFVPWTESAELARYLANATAYLFPSREPFGVAAVEALAAGCPVIAYDEGGSRDIVSPGKNGLLFSQQTSASLARALREFPEHDFDPDVVRQSAQRFDRTHFDRALSALADQLLAPDRESHA